MRHSLHSHILYLESKLQSLRDRLTQPRLSPDDVQGLELQVSLAELALARYREAYALEISVSSPEPPVGPGNDSEGGIGGRDNSRAGRKNGFDTSAAVKATSRARKRRHAEGTDIAKRARVAVR